MNQLSMKYAVLGDIHSNLEALRAVLEDATRECCTHYACVGDVVGYNGNPRECIALVRDLNMPCVKGNHDEYCSNNQTLEGLNARASLAIEWTRQQLADEEKQWLRDLRYVRLVAGFSLVHATLDAPQRWGYVFENLGAAASFTYQNTSVCFFGHTHLPMVFVRENVVRGDQYSKFRVERGPKYFVNVGSVGEPRDGGLFATYAIYDLAETTIELRRVSYDMAATEAKARAAGLPVRRKAEAVA